MSYTARSIKGSENDLNVPNVYLNIQKQTYVVCRIQRQELKNVDIQCSKSYFKINDYTGMIILKITRYEGLNNETKSREIK